MKKRKYLYGILLLLLLFWTGYQLYWYFRLEGNMVIYINNGAPSLERVEAELYIDDELVSVGEYQRSPLGGFHSFAFRLNLGFHKIKARAKIESNECEKEIKVFVGLAFVRWVEFELVDIPFYHDENEELTTSFFTATPYDTIQQSNFKTVYEYEFLTRVSICPLRFE